MAIPYPVAWTLDQLKLAAAVGIPVRGTMPKAKRRLICGAAAAVLCAIGAVSQPAEASLITVGSRAAFDAIGPFIAVDWGAFGPAGTMISTPDFRTIGGLTVGVTSTQGELARHDEGVDYLGNFAIGDHLLTDGGSQSDSFVITFGTPVQGFGTQIEPHYIRGAFTGTINVFGSGGLLGSIPISGTATNAQDNSALFVGIVSSAVDISFASFIVDQPDQQFPAGPVAINRLDVLLSVTEPVPVPEPASLALLAAGWLGMLVLRRPFRPWAPFGRGYCRISNSTISMCR